MASRQDGRVVGQLLEKTNLSAGRNDRHAVRFVDPIFDETREGVARPTKAFGTQMHVVDEKEDHAARRGSQPDVCGLRLLIQRRWLILFGFS